MKPFCTARCLRYSTEPPSTSIYNFNEINPEDKQVHQTRTPGSENWTNIQRKDHISSFSTFNLIEIMDRSTRYPLDSPLYLDNIYRRAAISIAIPFLISWKLTNCPRHPLSPINVVQNNPTKMFGYSSRATEHQMQTQ